MSSNAFARSRPRVRHQRVPKTQCYAHPRFLQLVKELARLDEAKKGQQGESDTNDSSSPTSCDKIKCGHDGSTTTTDNDDCIAPATASSVQIITQHNLPQTQNSSHYHHRVHNQHHHHHHNHQHHHQQQQLLVTTDCEICGRNNCVFLEPHSSNGYRSLGCNQSTYALHDNFYRQSSNNDNQLQQQQQQLAPHNLHHQGVYHHDHNQRHYNHPSNHQEGFNQMNNASGSHQHSHVDHRCPNKCPTNLVSANTSLGYPKTELINHSAESDQRQDENRSKRKRSTIDLSISSKKAHYQPNSPTSCSKRLKSTPEPARPLSPSFTKCPICLLDCMDRDPSFTNTCFHLFCFVCIENWSKSKATCPLCRTKFSKIIYNIKSSTCFDEKIASPIRRDDDDERIYDHLQFTANSMTRESRSSNVDDTRMIFDGLRTNDVLMPHFAFVNQIDSRQVESLHPFNAVTGNPNFSSNVPHNPFIPTNYNMGSNYIALISSSSRLQTAPNNPAISSAYTTSSLPSISVDTSNRAPRISRSGRYTHSRNYDLATIDASVRGSRSTNSNLNTTSLPLDTRHHHQVHQHSSHHAHHTHSHNPPQQRSTGTTIVLQSSRQSHRVEHQHIHLPYPPLPSRHYTSPGMSYARRMSYSGPQIDQHILDNLYRQMPDM